MEKAVQTWWDKLQADYSSSLELSSDVVGISLLALVMVILGVTLWKTLKSGDPIAAVEEKKLTKKQRREIEVRRAVSDIFGDAIEEELVAKHPRITAEEAKKLSIGLAKCYGLWDLAPRRSFRVAHPEEVKNKAKANISPEKAKAVHEKYNGKEAPPVTTTKLAQSLLSSKTA